MEPFLSGSILDSLVGCDVMTKMENADIDDIQKHTDITILSMMMMMMMRIGSAAALHRTAPRLAS